MQAGDAMVRGLPPAAFAFVMATGIVSVGLDGVGLAVPSLVLLAVAGVAFVVLLAFTLVRLVVARDAVRADLADPARAFGFFTTVAAGNVVGVRALAEGWTTLALVLLAVGVVGWVVLGYAIPWSVVMAARGRDLTQHVDGTWFVWIVACQSVAILAASLQVHHDGSTAHALAVVAVLGWGTGLGLYLVVGGALVVRVLRHGITAQALGPAFWVVTGAIAISVLAATRVASMSADPIADAVRNQAEGLAAVMWAFALWFVPPLLALGWWRHVRKRVPWHDGVGYWAMVFPMGMIAVSSAALGGTDHVPVATAFGHGFLGVAVAAWTVVTLGRLAVGIRRIAGSGRTRPG